MKQGSGTFLEPTQTYQGHIQTVSVFLGALFKTLSAQKQLNILLNVSSLFTFSETNFALCQKQMRTESFSWSWKNLANYFFDCTLEEEEKEES